MKFDRSFLTNPSHLDGTTSIQAFDSKKPITYFSTFSTDSRSILPQDCFVAIRGEQFDGHTYIKDCIQKGVRIFLIDNAEYSTYSNLFEAHSCLVVAANDVIHQLRMYAKHWRSRFEIPIIAVAGSAGKTTTKEFLASILRGRYKNILKTDGSENGFQGIAQTLLKLNALHSIAVIEVGIDEVGAMKQHIEVVQPTHSIVSMIGPEHLEKLIDIETVAKEECLILDHNPGRQRFFNLNDPYLRKMFETEKKANRSDQFSMFSQLEQKSEAESVKKSSEISAIETVNVNADVKSIFHTDGRMLEVSFGETGFSVNCPLPGFHNAQNLTGALAVALKIGLSELECINGLTTFKAAWGRSNLITLKHGLYAYADFYNAQPASMLAAFQATMASSDQIQKTTGRKPKITLCLADMKELGPLEYEFHSELGIQASGFAFDEVLVTGDRMKSFKQSYEKARHFSSTDELIQHLNTSLSGHDLVLIKGSRSMKMERVFEALKILATNENGNIKHPKS